jgi:hypothetical protein
LFVVHSSAWLPFRRGKNQGATNGGARQNLAVAPVLPSRESPQGAQIALHVLVAVLVPERKGESEDENNLAAAAPRQVYPWREVHEAVPFIASAPFS